MKRRFPTLQQTVPAELLGGNEPARGSSWNKTASTEKADHPPLAIKSTERVGAKKKLRLIEPLENP
jgi:hypothetical protein